MKSAKTLDIISLKIPHAVVKKLDNIAVKEDRSRSSIIRRLLIDYIEQYEDIKDALKARLAYEKDANSAVSLEKIMKDMNITKEDLDKTDYTNHD